MTKEEKIEKVRQTMNQIYPNIYAMAEQIVEAIEEPEEDRERFLDYELCYNPGGGYTLARAYLDENTRKIAPRILAITVGARIPDAKWAAVDNNNTMHFFKDQPTALVGDKQWYGKVCREPLALYPYCIYCSVKDWKEAKWRLE